jgi:hypothetical protein
VSQPEDLSPEEEQVRRLLADARHTAPMPDDVSARLDAVLADLRDEDPAAPDPVVVTQRPADLAAARRRRNARSWLVAAAAVVVVGIGVDQVVQGGGGSDDEAGGSSADSASSGQTVQRPAEDSGAGGGDAASSPSAASGRPEAGARTAPVRLDPTRFGTQVTRLRDGSTSARLSPAYRATCPARGWGLGSAVPVRYDALPGVLVFRHVQGDTQVVDLFLCGSDHPERSITLPAAP